MGFGSTKYLDEPGALRTRTCLVDQTTRKPQRSRLRTAFIPSTRNCEPPQLRSARGLAKPRTQPAWKRGSHASTLDREETR